MGSSRAFMGCSMAYPSNLMNVSKAQLSNVQVRLDVIKDVICWCESKIFSQVSSARLTCPLMHLFTLEPQEQHPRVLLTSLKHKYIQDQLWFLYEGPYPMLLMTYPSGKRPGVKP